MSFKKAAIIFFSYFYIAFIGISSAFLFLIALLLFLLTFLFDKRLILLNLYTALWSTIYIWCMPAWSVKVYGRHKMSMKKSYVVVSNHQSQLDILVAFCLFFPLRWISKAEVFRLPFIGWNMVLNGHVKLRRGNKESIKKMYQQCEDLLAKNVSIMMFPEGTRSKTGVLREFKPGAFALAKKMKKPIIPLAINNTKNALPKYSMTLQGRHKMTVKVLDEIPYSSFAHMEIEEISKMVRELIGSHVEEHIAHEREKNTGVLQELAN